MKQNNNSLGFAIGLAICGIILWIFPRVAGFVDVLIPAAICYGIGLIFLCVGVLGACVEVFKR